MAPRKLPWLEKGSAGKAKVKDSPKPAEKDGQNDIDPDDDDFFEGTILASSRKGKGRAGECCCCLWNVHAVLTVHRPF
jgi:hypothetical protein